MRLTPPASWTRPTPAGRLDPAEAPAAVGTGAPDLALDAAVPPTPAGTVPTAAANGATAAG